MYPEEPLDLSPSEGGGYFSAKMGQKLNGGKFQIVRKLGYGSRSSTWLVRGKDNYFAIKIYTIAASEHAKTVEVPSSRSSTILRAGADPFQSTTPTSGREPELAHISVLS